MKKLLDGRENDKERLFNTYMRQLDELSTSNSNKAVIREFVRDKQLEGVKNGSLAAYLSPLLRLLAHTDKDLKKLSASDLKTYFSKMQNTKSQRGTAFSSVTLDNHLRNIKFFYKQINGGKEFPECVEWIKENGRRKTKLPDDMLSEEEVEQLIRATDNTRDQAILSVLYDSAARASEFCNAKIKDVKFDQLGALMHVDGKTGPRSIRLINSVPYLRNWLEVHPFREEPNAFLWYNVRALKWQEVNIQTLSRIIDRAVLRAKLKKNAHPHLFRHSRLTALAPKVTEQVLKSYAGWSPDSRMAAVYVHMNGKHTDDALAKAAGIKIEESIEETRLKPIKCPRCKTTNAPTSKYCSTCSMILDERIAFLEKRVNTVISEGTSEIWKTRLALLEKELAELKKTA